MKLLLVLVILGAVAVPTIPVKAQLTNSASKSAPLKEGIQWVNGLNWEQVKQKAKAENKYIFVDCYTTWCVPCKRMDAEVYGDKNVGHFMNEKFINVKVQMDQTKKDNEEVKSWYKTAAMMDKKYSVTAFPSYLFFNPDGEIVHRDVGYAEAEKFTSLVSRALRTESQFYSLKKEFENGKREYSKFQYLLDEARRMKDYQFAQELTEVWFGFLSKKGKKEIYKKENLQFLASALPDTKSKWFKVFSENGEKVNKIMRQAGFARRAIDSAIAREYINPKLDRNNWVENPGWEEVYQEIKKDHGQAFALNNIVVKKFWWYRLKANNNEDYFNKYCNYFMEAFDIGALDTSYYRTDVEINYFVSEGVWKMNSEDRTNELLNKCIIMMEGVVRRSDNRMESFGNIQKDSVLTLEWKSSKIDNYASLLYLAGRKNEAIEWQERAVNHAKTYNIIDYKMFLSTLKSMRENTFH